MAKKNAAQTDEAQIENAEVEEELTEEQKLFNAAKSGEAFTQTVKATLVVTRDFAVSLKGVVKEFGENQTLTQDDVDYLGEMVDGRIANGFIKVKIST